MLNTDFPELPDFCRIPPEQRREAWAGRELRPVGGMIVVGRTVLRDPASEHVRREVEAAAAARREVELAKKRDDEALRRRGIKNQEIIKRAAAGEIVIPEPVKIVRVVDLNPQGHVPATEETDVKKSAAAKKRVQRAKKIAKARVAKPVRKASKANARTPVLVEGGTKINAVVQMVADMIGRKKGHPDAPLGGASMDELVKATGVEAHPMRRKIKQVRDVLKIKTVAPCKANDYRYHVAPKKAEG